MGLCGSAEAVESPQTTGAPQKKEAPAGTAARTNGAASGGKPHPGTADTSDGKANAITSTTATSSSQPKKSQAVAGAVPPSHNKHASEEEIMVEVEEQEQEQEQEQVPEEEVYYEQPPVTPKHKPEAVPPVDVAVLTESTEDEVKEEMEKFAALDVASSQKPKELDPALTRKVDPMDADALLAQVNAMVKHGFVPSKNMLKDGGDTEPPPLPDTDAEPESTEVVAPNRPHRGHQRVSSLADELGDLSDAGNTDDDSD